MSLPGMSSCPVFPFLALVSLTSQLRPAPTPGCRVRQLPYREPTKLSPAAFPVNPPSALVIIWIYLTHIYTVFCIYCPLIRLEWLSTLHTQGSFYWELRLGHEMFTVWACQLLKGVFWGELNNTSLSSELEANESHLFHKIWKWILVQQWLCKQLD